MAEQLKSPQREQRDHVADVEAVGRRVKSAIKGNWRGNFFGQFRRVGAIGNEAAPFQFFQDAHARSINGRWLLGKAQRWRRTNKAAAPTPNNPITDGSGTVTVKLSMANGCGGADINVTLLTPL
jgi:hypothetical protein